MTMQRKQVSYPRLLWRLGALWVLFPLIFAVSFGGIGLYMLQQARLLDRYGIEGTAVIEDKYTRTGRDSDGRTTVTYYLSFTFRPEGGAPLSASESVQRGFYNQVREGDEIPIRYVAHRPELNEIEPGSSKLLGWVFGGIGLVAAVVSVGLAGWMWRRKLSVLRAARNGEVRQARVTGTRRTNVQKNNRQMYVLQWIDATGQDGESRMFPHDALSAYPAGSVIVVYVDPKTGRGWWEKDF
ncbi:MAG: hypothetical protein JJU42_16015 [Rhodobacteraceae bacterium]|nr:hypothetical protein [Paracoccaceae bacterium]